MREYIEYAVGRLMDGVLAIMVLGAGMFSGLSLMTLWQLYIGVHPSGASITFMALCAAGFFLWSLCAIVYGPTRIRRWFLYITVFINMGAGAGFVITPERPASYIFSLPCLIWSLYLFIRLKPFSGPQNLHS